VKSSHARRHSVLHALALPVLLVCALVAPRAAVAHPVPFTYLDLRLEAGALEVTLVAHIVDLGHDLQVTPEERLLDPAVARESAGALGRLFAGRLQIRVDGQLLAPDWTGLTVLADRQSLMLSARHALTGQPGRIEVIAALFPYDPMHQTFLNIYEGGALTQAILDGALPRFEYFPGTRQGTFEVARRFLPEGIHHILIGPDHLLFLVGLLLLGGTPRRLALIVTAFTLAHSVTLSLAALNLVTPPARIVEPAIALSIVYVGADNLLTREGRDMRAWIAFAFGFIHGFGFASTLREMDLPARALGWSLFSFNVGVEIGQLLVVVIVATALAALRRRHEGASEQVAFAGSIFVMVAGGIWFVERAFGYVLLG
jgi:hydrogenase/urease accessory protein HupE